ncbi:unnamed protein product [Caenorhabditis bovis]|uniref:Palmitoyltransferase n=1 Tax=Caenorhabditis bovis TaxID=2654633 RepID=A0A8S1F6W0_9PELO|nr:unnamed protein product [Caenorhabditis bovis]
MLRSGITNYQLFSYVLTCLMLPATIFAFLPILTPYVSIGVVLLYIYIYILVIYLTIKDACVPELTRKIKKEGFKRRPFKSEPGRHVIENNKCNVCELVVEKYTKHCKRCNYCVGKFDHHCVWLNNCIGSANYRTFMWLVVSISLSSLAALCLSFGVLYLWFSNKNSTAFTCFGQFTEPLRISWLLCCVICGIVYMFAFVTTTHLLYFHIRLWKMGMTTYKFIVSKRRAKVSSLGTISTVSRTNTQNTQPDVP